LRQQSRVQAHPILERLRDAVNRHDLDAFLDCFDSSYRSEQPVHPDWAFTGREQVRQNWTAVFDGVPDIRAELLRSAEAGDTRWAEWYWQGTRIDGTQLEMRGVTIFGIKHDRITWGRLYMEDVDRSDGNIDQAVRRMTTTAD
jgi:ketosteroid isomerase-like protein